MHALVGFSAEVEDPPETHPRGLELARSVAAGLEQRGYSVVRTDNHRDMSHSVDLERDGKRVWFFVGWVGLENCDWQLAIPTNVGCLGRLKGADDSPERRELATVIHEVLTGDERISGIRWYESFSDAPEHPWATEPS